MSQDDTKIAFLPSRPKPQSDSLKIVAPYGGCQHRKFQVDERLQEVECSDCKAKLSPMWVLTQLAREDERLRNDWVRMRAHVQLMGERTRTKCRHCQKMTPVHSNASEYQVMQLADKIRREDAE